MSNFSIKLMKHSFYNESEVKQALINFLQTADRLSMWEQCFKFEKEFSLFQECDYTCLVNSGSSANLALLQALLNMGKLHKGDKVAFTALTWATNVMPLIQLGLVPVPIDIELETLNSNSKLFKEAIERNKDIKAFFITNVLGFCSDIDEIANVCKDRNILLIEDNCESLGTIYKNKKLGNYGIASTFSFFVGHHLSAIEGGAICTNDKALSDMLIMVRAHGWDRGLDTEKQKSLRELHSVELFYDQYTFYDLAYNIRPTEITGFLASLQLKYAHEIIDKRSNNFAKLHKASTENEDIVHMHLEHIFKISNFAYPVILKTPLLFEEYKKNFLNAGIEIRPIIGGNMLNQPFYKKYCKDESDFYLPNADFAHKYGFYLPNNPELTNKEIDFMCSLLKTSLSVYYAN